MCPWCQLSYKAHSQHVCVLPTASFNMSRRKRVGQGGFQSSLHLTHLTHKASCFEMLIMCFIFKIYTDKGGKKAQSKGACHTA